MGLHDRTPPTVEQYESYSEGFSNWGRWGPDDELGTLNHITEDVRKHAATLVTTGRSVSLSNPLPTEPGPLNPWPVQHYTWFGESNALDVLVMASHGQATTHVDALCHNFAGPGGPMYNGRSRSLIGMGGAEVNGIDAMNEGIFTRGVLYDIPRLRGEPYVGLDRPIHGWDLLDAAESQGVEPLPGDAVLIRGGRSAFFADHPDLARFGAPHRPGVHASVLEFLFETEAAMLGWDMMDASDQDYPAPLIMPDGNVVSFPVHFIALPVMGLPLLDNAELDGLAAVCSELGTYEFLFVTAPLVIAGGTGSPVNPLALF